MEVIRGWARGQVDPIDFVRCQMGKLNKLTTRIEVSISDLNRLLNIWKNSDVIDEGGVIDSTISLVNDISKAPLSFSSSDLDNTKFILNMLKGIQSGMDEGDSSYLIRQLTRAIRRMTSLLSLIKESKEEAEEVPIPKITIDIDKKLKEARMSGLPLKEQIEIVWKQLTKSKQKEETPESTDTDEGEDAAKQKRIIERYSKDLAFFRKLKEPKWIPSTKERGYVRMPIVIPSLDGSTESSLNRSGVDTHTLLGMYTILVNPVFLGIWGKKLPQMIKEVNSIISSRPGISATGKPVWHGKHAYFLLMPTDIVLKGKIKDWMLVNK